MNMEYGCLNVNVWVFSTYSAAILEEKKGGF